MLNTGFYRSTPYLLYLWALVQNTGSTACFFTRSQEQIPGVPDPETLLEGNVTDSGGFLLGHIFFDWADPQVVEPGELSAFVVSEPFDWKPGSVELGEMPACAPVTTGSLSATVTEVNVTRNRITGIATNSTGHDLTGVRMSVVGLDSSGRVAATAYETTPGSVPWSLPAGAKIRLDATIVAFGKPDTFKVYVSAGFFGATPPS